MTDKEMLELAAKAAGYAVKIVEERGRPFPVGVWTERADKIYWNPLADDGDALRLAVELGRRYMIVIEIGHSGADVQFDGHAAEAFERNDDVRAATRLAVVRAAAEIGRNMP